MEQWWCSQVIHTLHHLLPCFSLSAPRSFAPTCMERAIGGAAQGAVIGGIWGALFRFVTSLPHRSETRHFRIWICGVAAHARRQRLHADLVRHPAQHWFALRCSISAYNQNHRCTAGISAVSWAAMLSTFRGSHCALVRIRGRDDATNSFIAGAPPPPRPLSRANKPNIPNEDTAPSAAPS
jgi:hypothetical protein